MNKDTTLQQYLAESSAWDANRTVMNERSARTAWRIAIGACALTVMAMATLMMLMPLKHVQPIVIRVNDTTGVVDIVPLYEGTKDIQELVTRGLLHRYVIACERFSFFTAEMDYADCGSFNAAARAREWVTLWDRNNPQSPLNVYRDGTTISVDINSVTFFKRGNGVEDLAQVRFTKKQRAGGAGTEQRSQWIATVQYVYDKPPKDDRLRVFNALGLKVVDYRVEPEAVNTPTAVTGGVQ